MLAYPFTNVLCGQLGTRLQWEKWHRCPCTGAEGAARPDCPLCAGEGGTFDAPSAIFRGGVVAVSAKAIENMRARLGPGLEGDASLSIAAPGPNLPSPAYGQTAANDRFLMPDAMDPIEWVITPNTPLLLPTGAQIIETLGLGSGGNSLVTVALPSPGDDGRITVTRNVVVRMKAPRRFRVVTSLGKLRSWMPGLPEPFLLKQIDMTVR